MSVTEDREQFYQILRILDGKIGGKRSLSNCSANMNWPERGMYFFFEKSEHRKNKDMRVVRVGTHALKRGSCTTLWDRLRQHRGNINGNHPGGGNHRGSIFRLHVGTALISKTGLDMPSWSIGNTASQQIIEQEYQVEKLVSEYICSMPFVWVDIGDLPGPDSMRGYIERNSISLLSNYGKNDFIDKSSSQWLGHYAWSDKIKQSGLWNVNHIDETYDPSFLEILRKFVEESN